jgi:hypothetical protein
VLRSGVSTSGYYAWRKRPESKRAQRDRELTEHQPVPSAQPLHLRGAEDHAELTLAGVSCGRKRVARLMRGDRATGRPQAQDRHDHDSGPLEGAGSAPGCTELVIDAFDMAVWNPRPQNRRRASFG